MVRRREQISKVLKEQIISKLSEPDCSVADLRRLYGISKTTLYKWRHEAIKQVTDASIQACGRKFVELLVEEPSNHLLESKLQKASLTFDDFSISIEGRVSSSKFISILKILEEPC